MNNQSDNLPGGVPLFVSGWGAGSIRFNESASFWDDAERATSEGLLADHVDAAMVGRSSPRVWLFLHEPGEGNLSAASALSFARELAQRDQAVLLLDGDDDSADLTSRAGRIDKDGWIDLVRYGSSVLSCGHPMPFDGRRGYFLGVGSFTPAEVTGPEVKELLLRLKRQADDILVVAPADAVGRLWAAEADLRLLCWNRAQRSVSLVEELAENFSAAGIPLTGMIGFGLPQTIEKEDFSEAIDEVMVEDAPGVAASIFDELEDQAEDPAMEEEEFAHRKGNSGVFWMAAMAFLVLIGGASVYYLKFLRVPMDGHFPASAQQEVALGGAAFFDSGAAVIQDEVVTEGSDNLDRQSSDGEAEAGNQPQDLPVQDQVSMDDPAEDQAVSAIVLTEEIEIPVIEEKAVPVLAPADDVFGMSPYVLPVGSDGWTLHVYSFPDSMGAEQEMAVLASKGFHSVTRTVQIKEKGRWFRLYLGSFKTKAEANIARKKLMVELGEDWANPVRF